MLSSCSDSFRICQTAYKNTFLLPSDRFLRNLPSIKYRLSAPHGPVLMSELFYFIRINFAEEKKTTSIRYGGCCVIYEFGLATKYATTLDTKWVWLWHFVFDCRNHYHGHHLRRHHRCRIASAHIVINLNGLNFHSLKKRKTEKPIEEQTGKRRNGADCDVQQNG